MRHRFISVAFYMLSACSVLTAQTTDNASDKIIKHTSREDSLFYASLSDTIFPSRSGVTGDAMDNPIQVGPFTNSFNFTDTRNTSSSYTHQYGRNTADVYYCLVLTAPMNVTFTHEGSAVTDTYMYLLDSDGNLIVSNDDYAGEWHCSSIYNSFISRQLTAGTYYIVSEGYAVNGSITTNITANSSAGFGYPVIPSAYSTESNPVGGMGGQFGVSSMGGATYSIPIEVPLGVNGMQPNIAITYNSQAGNGVCGYGASISGLSSITRGPKNIYHDGAAYGMQYYGDDAFYLDGVRLILSSGTAGQDGAVYYPESDPYTKVLQHGTCYTGTNYMWFEVTNKAGVTCWYGYSTGRHKYYVSGNQKTLSWNLMYMVDPFGNELAIDYQTINNVIYPVAIRYGMNNRSYNPLENYVYFNYETRPDSITYRFDNGVCGVMNRRLESITTQTYSTIYRQYKLNYNDTGDGTAYKYSRLVSVTEKNGQDETLPATRLTWSYLPSTQYASESLNVGAPSGINHLVSFPFSSQTFLSGDLNSDGVSDIIGKARVTVPIGINNNVIRTYVYIYYSYVSPSGVVSYLNGELKDLPPDIYIGNTGKNEMGGISCLDIDGDGANELIVPSFVKTGNTKYVQFHLFWQNGNEDIISENISSIHNSMPTYTIGDIDNDGKDDIVYAECIGNNGGNIIFHVLRHNPNYNGANNLVTKESYPSPNSLYPLHLFVCDMNNNGINDIFSMTINGHTVFWNQGRGTGTISFREQSSTSCSIDATPYILRTGDFNGDGLMDMLINNAGSNWWQFHLNNGNGTFSTHTACSLDIYEMLLMDKDNDKFCCNVLDFDCDGRSDVVITKATYTTGGSFIKTDTYWMRSTGIALEQVYHSVSNNEDDALANKYITGDFDGDGRVELVNYGYDCVTGSIYNSNTEWRIYKNSNLTAQSGKVVTVTGDFGVTTDITYSTLTDPDVYTRGTSTPYPAPKYTVPINVVKRTFENNGASRNINTCYSYSDLRIHLQGKGVLGFCSTEARITTLGKTVTSTVTGWNDTFYVPSGTQTCTTLGNKNTLQTITMDILDMSPDAYHKWFYSYPSQITEKDFDNHTVTTTRSIVDSIGLPATETVQYAQNMYRTVEYSDYIMAGRRYQPQTVVSRQRHPDDSSEFSNTIRNSYNSTTGALTRNVDGAGSSDSLTTDYTYTTFGHVFSKQLSGDGIGYYIQYYGYDNTKRFLIKEYSSPEAYVMEYTYDLWGNRLTEKDNSNTSYPVTITHTYDNWGNLIRTEKPGGGVVTYTKGWNNYTDKRYFILTQGTDRPWVKIWYDNHGREVLMESIDLDDVRITRETFYDIHATNDFRKIVEETKGYNTLTHNYRYDGRGRIVQESHPGNNNVSYSYSSDGLTTTVIDNSRQTTYTYDVMGNVKQVDDPVSGQVKHKYSSCGGIRETQVNEAVWTIGYDDRGNRASLTDPDAGTTTYEYDALGRERKRTDARGVVFVTYYNYLGNVTYINASKNSDSETIYYTYGTSGTGKFRLVGRTLGNWTESYEYDQYGRMTMENRGGHTSTFEYSQTGLVSRMTWVSGNDNSNYVDYTYDTYGNCIGKSAMSGAVQWNLTGNTGTITTSTMRLHSNTSPFTRTTTLDYNGNLSSVTLTRNNNTVSSASYVFNQSTGDLAHRTLDGITQSFTYDNAGRLTGVSVGGQDVMNMTYAGNGNIMSKTGIGDYEYSSAKPHAVEAVDNTSGLIPEGTQSVTYNLWGKVSEVNAVVGSDTYRYELTYGPDLQRVLAVLWKNNSLVHLVTYGRDYEEKYVGSDITRYYYINGTDGNAAVYTSNSSGGKAYCMDMDHLGSITGLYDQYGTKCYGASFDPWGKRTLMSGSIEFDRGFTGHEHIDEINLIDMNGRMYDPLLGRFLSADPFVQAPTNPQNYNRYSYCLNNPLRYTDPNGELFWEAVLIGAAIYGTGNLITHSIRGDVNDFGDGCRYFFQGAFAGAALGATWYFAPYIPWIGYALQSYMTLNFYVQLGMAGVSSIVGLGKASTKQGWDAFYNAWEIYLGNYYIDDNFFRGMWQGYSRHSWEILQTGVGHLYSQFRNIDGRVDRVDYMDGATFVTDELEYDESVSFGPFININNPNEINVDFKQWVLTHPLYMHEYGHTIDSRLWGPSYLFCIGISSARSVKRSHDITITNKYGVKLTTTTHRIHWTEERASLKAYHYFNKYHDVDINVFGNYLPYQQTKQPY